MKDRLGRDIIYTVENLDIVAIHDGREVGRAQFVERVWGDGYKATTELVWVRIDVDQQYRKAGIGIGMVRHAVECYGHFCRPSLSAVGGHHVPAEDYYTEEGAALVRKCIRERILPPRDDD